MTIFSSSFPIFLQDAGTGRLPERAWFRSARQGQEKPVGIFIAALNPYRQLDAFYEGFLDLVAGQIAASITNANAYEQERKRARTRRAGPRQDGVLQQREPRAADPADPDSGPC